MVVGIGGGGGGLLPYIGYTVCVCAAGKGMVFKGSLVWYRV